jgi:hypothetical protein
MTTSRSSPAGHAKQIAVTDYQLHFRGQDPVVLSGKLCLFFFHPHSGTAFVLDRAASAAAKKHAVDQGYQRGAWQANKDQCDEFLGYLKTTSLNTLQAASGAAPATWRLEPEDLGFLASAYANNAALGGWVDWVPPKAPDGVRNAPTIEEVKKQLATSNRLYMRGSFLDLRGNENCAFFFYPITGEAFLLNGPAQLKALAFVQAFGFPAYWQQLEDDCAILYDLLTTMANNSGPFDPLSETPTTLLVSPLDLASLAGAYAQTAACGAMQWP